MVKGESFYRIVYRRALDLFQEQCEDGPQAWESCWGVAQEVGGEYQLGDAARAWLAQDLLVEAIAREMVKSLLREGSAGPEHVARLLDEAIGRASAGLPASLKEAVFASLLKERCAPLVYRLCAQIQSRASRQKAGQAK